MDLLDFNGEAMYFDEPVTPRVEALLAQAAEHYGAGPEDTGAELCLLRAYFLEPEHLTVLVALYRYFYYRRQYARRWPPPTGPSRWPRRVWVCRRAGRISRRRISVARCSSP